MCSFTKRNAPTPTRPRACDTGCSYLDAMSYIVSALLMLVTIGATRTIANAPHVPLPPAWLPEAEELLVLQDYPTLSAAAQGIGRNLRQTVDEVLLSSDGIAVMGREYPMSVENLAAVASSVRQEFPATKVRVVETVDECREKEICISLWAENAASALIATVLFPARHETSRGTIRVAYGNETWLAGEDLSEHQMIARSERLADQREATQQCQNDAVQRLVEVCQEHAQRVYVDEGVYSKIPFDMEYEIRKRLDRFTIKEFSQRLETSGNSAFRHAMLLDTTELNSMFVELNNELHHRNEVKWAWTTPYLIRFGSVIGLLLAVASVYFVLDGLTQGYYNATIKTGLTVFGIIGLVILFLTTAG